jgi:hypothetical protein
VQFRPGRNSALKDGWRKKKNVIIVLIVDLSYSGERKGAGIVNNPLMWIVDAKGLRTLFSP